MFIPLSIGPEERRRIKELIEYANAHPYSFADLFARLKDPGIPPIGNSPNHRMRLPEAFSVIYTIAEQRPPVGMTRHLSMALQAGDHVLHPACVEMVMREFGFRGGLGSALAVWEEAAGRGIRAVNVVETLEPIPSPT